MKTEMEILKWIEVEIEASKRMALGLQHRHSATGEMEKDFIASKIQTLEDLVRFIKSKE